MSRLALAIKLTEIDIWHRELAFMNLNMQLGEN